MYPTFKIHGTQEIKIMIHDTREIHMGYIGIHVHIKIRNRRFASSLDHEGAFTHFTNCVVRTFGMIASGTKSE